ncbi:hypothetical protein COM08_25265 [Bacillus wiedmannii]|uniref:hypothetical protein n=1 Tax=Bacillus wiedmannii TaxID=1890302 RepID=UPI000BF433C6|nr:hypothetical protein [Bacillus wiedmannii]PGC14160.1 hypothetical protein COM08_25265 [Bacillus wiedmannii]
MAKKRRYLKKKIEEANKKNKLGNSNKSIIYQNQITQNSKEFIGLNKKIQDQYKTIIEQSSPLLAIQDQYKTIIEQSNPLLAIQDQYKTIVEQSNPLLAIQDSYKTIVEQSSPLLAIQDSYKTIVEQSSPLLAIQDQYKTMLDQYNKPLLDMDNYKLNMQRLVQEQMGPIIEAQKLIYNQIKPMLEVYKDIDWDSMSRAAAEELKEIDRKLIENEEEYWCLDIDIMTNMLNGEVTKDTLSEYIENRLEEYIEKITRNPMYEIHVSLIQEAYEAYKIGLYKLCIMPLFAAFEHVIAFWFKGHITKEMISIKSNPDVPRLYKKINLNKYYEIDVEQYKKTFALSVLRTYKNTFITGPKELGVNLNRNSIAHGFHDYNSLSKLDVLKLFQLLKSTLVLQFVDSGNVAES